MFGLSLTKIIFTVLAVVIVWNSFKWVARMQEKRDALAKENLRPGTAESKRAEAPIKDIEDMVKCKVCDSFVASNNTVSCGRDDCPYTG